MVQGVAGAVLEEEDGAEVGAEAVGEGSKSMRC